MRAHPASCQVPRSMAHRGCPIRVGVRPYLGAPMLFGSDTQCGPHTFTVPPYTSTSRLRSPSRPSLLPLHATSLSPLLSSSLPTIMRFRTRIANVALLHSELFIAHSPVRSTNRRNRPLTRSSGQGMRRAAEPRLGALHRARQRGARRCASVVVSS